MSFMTAKSQLINEIFMTREFNNLRLAKNRLFENKELASQVNDFNKKRMALQQNTDTENMAELEAEYRKLMASPEAHAYFNASNNMSNFIMNFMNDLNSAIENNLK